MHKKKKYKWNIHDLKIKKFDISEVINVSLDKVLGLPEKIIHFDQYIHNTHMYNKKCMWWMQISFVYSFCVRTIHK